MTGLYRNLNFRWGVPCLSLTAEKGHMNPPKVDDYSAGDHLPRDISSPPTFPQGCRHYSRATPQRWHAFRCLFEECICPGDTLKPRIKIASLRLSDPKKDMRPHSRQVASGGPISPPPKRPVSGLCTQYHAKHGCLFPSSSSCIDHYSLTHSAAHCPFKHFPSRRNST